MIELLNLLVHLDDNRHRIPLPHDEGIHERIERGCLILSERARRIVEKIELSLADGTLCREYLALRLKLLDRSRVFSVLFMGSVRELSAARYAEDPCICSQTVDPGRLLVDVTGDARDLEYIAAALRNVSKHDISHKILRYAQIDMS